MFSNTQSRFWVECVGDLIVARVRYQPTEALLRECHEEIVRLVRETGKRKILYDALEMIAPPVDVPLSQWKLDAELGSLKLRRAIVVSDTKLAYLARIAFGEEHRVFYNDLVAAIEWLKS